MEVESWPLCPIPWAWAVFKCHQKEALAASLLCRRKKGPLGRKQGREQGRPAGNRKKNK